MNQPLQNAREKLGRVLEIYTPFGAARANAILAMTAAVTEFEEAIRQDERAALAGKLETAQAETNEARALAHSAEVERIVRRDAAFFPPPVETPPPPAPEPVSRDESGALGVDTPNVEHASSASPDDYQGEGLPPLNYMPDFANGGPLEKVVTSQGAGAPPAEVSLLVSDGKPVSAAPVTPFEGLHPLTDEAEALSRANMPAVQPEAPSLADIGKRKRK